MSEPQTVAERQTEPSAEKPSEGNQSELFPTQAEADENVRRHGSRPTPADPIDSGPIDPSHLPPAPEPLPSPELTAADLDPWHESVTSNARRSLRKRIKAKIKDGTVTEAERDWYKRSQKKPPAVRIDSDQPSAPPIDPAPVSPETGDTSTRHKWAPARSGGVSGVSPGSTATPPPKPAAPKTAEQKRAEEAAAEAEATAAVVGASVTQWVMWAHSECVRLGKPWPIPPIPLPPATAPKTGEIDERPMSDAERVVFRVAATAGESAARVSLKYRVRVPYQDEAITVAAVVIPAILWRAAVADAGGAKAERERVKRAKDANPKPAAKQPSEDDGSGW